MNKLSVTICSSANFYKQAVEAQAFLQAKGFTVNIPHNAEVMKKSGNYDVAQIRTWFNNPKDYAKKSQYMRWHFDEVDKADVVLVINNEKHGVANYIGGNVLIEMALAFYQRKPIFILNERPSESAFLEEIIAMEPVELHGKLEAILPHLADKASKSASK